MESADPCQQEKYRERYSGLTFFLTNTRSAKGKCTELTTLNHGYNIICLTETYLDNSIESQCILENPDFDFFRRDRNIHGGGVLIAVN